MILTKNELTALLTLHQNYLCTQINSIQIAQDNSVYLKEIEVTLDRINEILNQ